MYQNLFTRSMRMAAVGAAAALVFGASAAHADALKCRRSIAKNAAAFEAAKIKALQKCNDALLNGKVTACPDGKAADKIAAAQQKLDDKIAKDCAGATLADMNFAGLATQCSGGFFPGQPCNSATDCAGECTNNGLACFSDAFCGAGPGSCAGLGQCDPVDYCPSVQNDAQSEPFGLTASTDCYFPLSDEASVASCVACVGEQTVDQLIGDYYGTANPASADKGTRKCQRALGKVAAKHFATVRKALQKCEDGVLKSGSGSCPDAKASDKIGTSQTKLSDAITKACSQDQLNSGFVLSRLIGASGRPAAACATLGSTSADVAGAIECLTSATAEGNDALGIGSSPQSANPLCGNSHLDPGETCDDGNALQESGVGAADFCPVDCSIAACTPSGTQTATVSFASPVDLTGLTVVLYYPDAKVQVPGNNNDPPVQAAVSSSSFATTPVDTGYALRVVLVDPFLAGVPVGEAFTVTFSTCTGAPALSAADLTCFVADATDVSSAPVYGTTCSVTVP